MWRGRDNFSPPEARLCLPRSRRKPGPQRLRCGGTVEGVEPEGSRNSEVGRAPPTKQGLEGLETPWNTWSSSEVLGNLLEIPRLCKKMCKASWTRPAGFVNCCSNPPSKVREFSRNGEAFHRVGFTIFTVGSAQQYPLVNVYSLLLNMAIEIVDLCWLTPGKRWVIFQFANCQRVRLW